MKFLSFLIALIAITTLELQATNPCLCEYWIARFGENHGELVANFDSIKVDTCQNSPTYSKYFVIKGYWRIQNKNPFKENSYSQNQIMTEDDIDEKLYPQIKITIGEIRAKYQAKITTSNSVNNFTQFQYLDFDVVFPDYFEDQVIDELTDKIDTSGQVNIRFGVSSPKMAANIKLENEELQFLTNTNQIQFAEIFEEVTLIDLLGKTIN